MNHELQLQNPEGQRLLTALRAVTGRLSEVQEVIDGFGHTTFKVRKKSFVIAGMGEDGASISIKSDPTTQSHLIRRGPYYRTPYIGQHGWVSIRDPLTQDWAEVEELIVDAYRRAAPKRLAQRVPPDVVGMSGSEHRHRLRREGRSHDGKVRPLKPADREEWLHLLAQLYSSTTEADHEEPVDAYIAGVRHRELLPSAVFVAERPAGGLCGFLELSVRNYAEGCTGETPYIESWFVDAEHRGKNVGRALVEAAESWARERGYTEIASDTGLDNRTSQSAHGALGFEEVERTVHFRKSL